MPWNTTKDIHFFAPLLVDLFGCVAILGRLSTSFLLSRHHFTIHTRNQPARDNERRCSFVLCRQNIVTGGGPLLCTYFYYPGQKNRYSREIHEVAPRWINLMNISALTIFLPGQQVPQQENATQEQHLNSIKKNRTTMDDPACKVCDASRPPASDAHSTQLSTDTGLALKRSKNSAICEAARPPTSDAYSTLLRAGTGLVLKCSKLRNLRPVVFLFVISITSSTSSCSITESNASSFSSRDTSVGDAARPPTSDADSTLLSTGTGLALQQTPQLSARPPQLEARRLSFRHEHDVQNFHNRVTSSFSSRDTGDAILSVRNQNCQLATVCSYLNSLCACTFVEHPPLWMPLLSAFEQSSSPWWF